MMSTSQQNTSPSKRRGLLSPEEYRQLQARKRRGKVSEVLAAVPMVLAVALILFIFLSNINSSFAWQIVEHKTSGRNAVSGEQWSAAKAGSVGQTIRLELSAQGMSEQEIEEFVNDPEAMRKWKARNRIEHLPVANGERDQVVVVSYKDNLKSTTSYLSGLGEKEQEAMRQGAEEGGYDMYLNPLLDTQFLLRNNSKNPLAAGFFTGIISSLWVIFLVIIFATLIGVATAIYLEEYAPQNALSSFLELNLRNLAGVPSIVYGLLGFFVFVRVMGLGQSVLAGALTLALLILPVVVVAAREAIRAVPSSLRQASYGLGATKWQTVQQVVLPNAVTGIVTGVILAVARAIGETAPLLMVGAANFVSKAPGGWDFWQDPFAAMPLQLYSWFGAPQSEEFRQLATAGILVLLSILIILYLLAFFIRMRFERRW